MTLRSLNAIGFACRSRQELAATLATIIDKQAEPITTPLTAGGGIVRHWRGASGAEIVFRYRPPPSDRRADDRVNALTDLVGMSPFHHGQGAHAVTPIAAFTGPTDDPLAGLWQIALQADRHTGRAPSILVEIVPFEPIPATTSAPLPRNLQIVGFCHRLDVFTTLSDYLLHLPAKLLCPPGSIVPAASVDTLHRRIGKTGQAAAMITGEVIQLRRLINPVTGLAYQWLLVATERGPIDLLTAAEQSTSKLCIGTLVCAQVDLVARPTDRAVLAEQMPVFAPHTPRSQTAATIDDPMPRSTRRSIGTV